MKLLIKTICICFLAGLMACKKDDKSPPTLPAPATPPPTQPATGTGSLKIELSHLVDTAALVFGKSYTDPKGDTFQVTKFNYFISNIVLVNANSATYTESKSYHLVKHADNATKTIVLNDVPAGSYTSITFMLGVDSLANVSGAHSGDLDLSKSGDMYWGWSSGYIFFKLEGFSPKSGDAQKNLTYHIGGYSGATKGQRTVKLSFLGNTADVTSSKQPLVQLKVNVNELFKSPTLIDMSTMYNHMSANSPNNKIFADNYSDMISFGNLKNP